MWYSRFMYTRATMHTNARSMVHIVFIKWNIQRPVQRNSPQYSAISARFPRQKKHCWFAMREIWFWLQDGSAMRHQVHEMSITDQRPRLASAHWNKPCCGNVINTIYIPARVAVRIRKSISMNLCLLCWQQGRRTSAQTITAMDVGTVTLSIGSRK